MLTNAEDFATKATSDHANLPPTLSLTGRGGPMETRSNKVRVFHFNSPLSPQDLDE